MQNPNIDPNYKTILSTKQTEAESAVAQGKSPSRRSSNAEQNVPDTKIGMRLFVPFDVFDKCYLQYLEKQELFSIRLLCKTACQLFMNHCDTGGPINKFWHNFGVKFSDPALLICHKPIDGIQEFFTNHKIPYILRLDENNSLKFIKIFKSDILGDESDILGDEIKKRMNEVRTLILNIDPEKGCCDKNTECVDAILNSIKRHPQAFCNLEYLTITNFADLTDCQALRSIKHFKCIDLCERDVKILNLVNLETIEIESTDWNTFFKIEALPKLKSLTIGNLRKNIEIELSEVPNLEIIILNEKKISIDRSNKTILLAATEHEFIG